jgi:nucleolar protein 14
MSELQYEKTAKRIVPEALNFLALSLLLLAPHSFSKTTVPGSFPTLDAFDDGLRSLRISSKAPADVSGASLTRPANSAALLATSLSLLDRFARLYVSHDSFIEMFAPIQGLVQGLTAKKLPPSIQQSLAQHSVDLERMLKLSTKERKPLALQHFKPAPIKTFAPRFEDSFRPGQHAFDPDAARSETAKLKGLLKKEKKGAVRELRKDARFIAGERARMRNEKDAEYTKKIAGIRSDLREERAEEKSYEREKKRLKRADKKRAGGK